MNQQPLPICPLCGKPYIGYPALSRRDNQTEICPDCGLAEATHEFRMWKPAFTKSDKPN